MKNLYLFICILLFTLGGCNNPGDSGGFAEEETEMVRRISNADFGTTPDGEKVEVYTLKNVNGLEMEVITYGGIIRTLRIPDRDGKLEDVVLGYDHLEGYVENNPYFGAIIGRYGNRIARGRFSLDGQEYTLATNNNLNHLHGGIRGFDKVVWQAEPFEEADATGLRLTYQSADGEEGYPGNLEVSVTYTLDDQDQLIFDYEASTDQPTIVNLTNHAYYNLTGMKENILGHKLEINAENYLPVDSTLIPEEPQPVAGTPFDFTEPQPIGSRIEEDNIQLANGLGYDHCWILNRTTDTPGYAASLYDSVSGRFMEIFTTEPGIQFYSGNFLNGNITGKAGQTYEFRSGLCLETQHFPDSPNRPDFPSVRLNPDETYSSRTITKFSTK